MKDKIARQRRAKKIRKLIRRLGMYRLSVHKTSKHIYAQLLTHDGSKVLASSSSLDKSLRSILTSGGNIQAAKVVGKDIAEKALKLGIERVAFDRSGFKYHGRISALADAAREAGLKF